VVLVRSSAAGRDFQFRQMDGHGDDEGETHRTERMTRAMKTARTWRAAS
jgi:hypothetical protein